MKNRRIRSENELKNLLPEDVFFHSVRVARLSEKMGELLKLDVVLRHKLYLAGLHHDVGKKLVDSPIWNKKGNLTKEEFDLAKRHPIESARYLMSSEDHIMNELSIYVKHHHESYDGTGYPDGIMSDEIPLLSRIIAVCDAFDAMTSVRPYREFAYTPERALSNLKKNSGQMHDPELIEILDSNFTEMVDVLSKKVNRDTNQLGMVDAAV